MMVLRRDLPAWTLDDLLAGLVEAGNCPSLPVSGLTLDSRATKPGWVFFALGGTRRHGIDFAADAVGAGAVAVVAEPDGDHAPQALAALAGSLGVPVVPARGLAERLSAIAGRFHAEPSRRLRVVGVTGTNGKTSVTQLLAQALADEGRCGVLGTLGYGFPGDLQAASHTTPDAILSQRWLEDLHAAGARAVAMEVSSHALHQHRVAGVAFDTAVFTNLTRDHLDYHGSMAAYGEAKARLFRAPGLRLAVVNVDDAFGRELLRTLEGPAAVACGETAGAGDAKHYLRVEHVDAGRRGLRLRYASSWGAGEFTAPLFGRFNAENLALVAAVLLAWGVSTAEVAARLARLAPVPGRMEPVEGDPNQPLVVVDYAHTPDALAKVLESLRAHAAGDLVCVFGCGGERDPGKRPLMGGLAERLADRVVLTDDNPRGEDGRAIIDDILSGCRDAARVTVLRDRAEAIRRTVRGAGAGDLVVVAGKGHEDCQLVGDRRLPFSDTAHVRAALAGEAP